MLQYCLGSWVGEQVGWRSWQPCADLRQIPLLPVWHMSTATCRGWLESAVTNVPPDLTGPSSLPQEVSAVLGPAAACFLHPSCAAEGHPPLGPACRAGTCPWHPSTYARSFLTPEHTAALHRDTIGPAQALGSLSPLSPCHQSRQ